MYSYYYISNLKVTTGTAIYSPISSYQLPRTYMRMHWWSMYW